MVLYSNHHIQDSDRQLNSGIAYVEIRLDSYYDGDPFQWISSGDLDKKGQNYDKHRVDWAKAYRQTDIDNDFNFHYEQTVVISEEVLHDELNDADEELKFDVIVFTKLYYRYFPYNWKNHDDTKVFIR